MIGANAVTNTEPLKFVVAYALTYLHLTSLARLALFAYRWLYNFCQSKAKRQDSDCQRGSLGRWQALTAYTVLEVRQTVALAVCTQLSPSW